jgi:hypothetical protein
VAARAVLRRDLVRPAGTRRVLVYRGREHLRTQSGVDVLPFEAFAEALFAGRL